MTRALAAVPPKTPVAQVASMMRDLNIGDVLVLEDGKLRGIVTDRDLTINVLTNGAKSDAPVERYMTTDVVTGSPDWSLEQIADVMGKHQVRRLPIVEEEQVVGIVSLGDVALHTPKRDTVANSLKNISDSARARFKMATPLTKFATIAIPIALGAVVLVAANTKSGKRFRAQVQSGEAAEQARAAINDAVRSLQDPRTRQAALDALESTGLPDRTRQLIQESTRALQENARMLQDTQARAVPAARERVMQFADDTEGMTRRQMKQLQKQLNAQQLPKELTRRFQKQNEKRFIFA
jgi:predicted transcriptional regulator